MTSYEKYTALRDSRGITDYRVAQATGIWQSTFTDWRKGLYKPKVEKLQLIADLFNVPIEDLIDDEC